MRIIYILVFIISASLCMSCSLHVAGNGTKSDPYRIKTIAQLNNVRHHPNAHYLLVNDLDFADSRFDSAHSENHRGWLPIACDTSVVDTSLFRENLFEGAPFGGSFDGAGHTIRNLYINRPTEQYVGLFGYVDSTASIVNLFIESANVTGEINVGALAGVNNGRIRKCRSMGVIAGNRNVGGLVGDNRGTMHGCTSQKSSVRRSIGIAHKKAAYQMGGLVGINSGMMHNCNAQNQVRGRKYVGGLVGKVRKGTVSSCFVEDSEVSGHDQVGGLVGASSGQIKDCRAVTTVSGVDDIGGLIGYNSGDISDSYAQGEIKGRKNVGGFIGANYGNISSCRSHVLVSGKESFGGFVGNNLKTIVDCHSRGTVSSRLGKESGGFAGRNKRTIRGCYSDCDVDQGKGSIGGFIGYNTGHIEQCYSRGVVRAREKRIGGFAGVVEGEINNCFTTSDLKGTAGRAARFASSIKESGKLKHVYSIGRGQQNSRYLLGLAGYSKGEIEECFWDPHSRGPHRNIDGHAKPTILLKQKQTYIDAGWDFKTIWFIDRLVNQGYPFLRTFTTVPLTRQETGKHILPHDPLTGNIKDIRASSTLRGKTNHIEDNIFDHDLTSVWLEGVPGGGEGEWVEIELLSPMDIPAMILVNGCISSAQTHEENNRIKELSIQGVTPTDTINRAVLLPDVSLEGGTFDPRGLKLQGFENVKIIRFSIGDVYKGSKYDNTGISEIIFIR